MENSKIAKILFGIADLLEMKEVEFKPRAYRKAAQTIEAMSQDIAGIYKQGGKKALDEIPGVGASISEKIEEILKTGKLKYYEKLRKETPVDTEGLMSIEGMGPKKVKRLYKELGVKSVKDLERAAKKGRIKKLKGMGQKVEAELLEAVKFSKKKTGRMLLGSAMPTAEELIEVLKKTAKIDKIEAAGSFRRWMETIGDLDILVVSKDPAGVMDAFTSLKSVSKVLAKGQTKSSVRLGNGLQVDLRIVDMSSWGSALMYFTGSKTHNIELRKIAIKKGWKLSEYGVFKGDKQLAGKTEDEVYKKLGMQFVPPEMRENIGEIELALDGKLPSLVGYNDIKGDLQFHTKWSDGTETLEQMVRKGKELGYSYMCVTDHVGTLKIAGGLDEKALKKQAKEIAAVDNMVDGIAVLQGAEVNILADGTLDMPDSALKGLDVVIAAIHSGFRGGREKQTKRVLGAMENEHVDIIAHPTGRVIGKRAAYDLDWQKVFDKSKETKTYLEINAFPDRLDLSDMNTHAALKAGCKLVINTDAHHSSHFENMKFGVGTARRAWARKSDILNTLPLKKFMKAIG